MNETAMQIITIVIGAAGGGGVAAAWFKYRNDSKTQKKDYFSLIADRLDKEVIRLNKALETQRLLINEKEDEIDVLNALIKEREIMISELKKDKTNYLAIIQVLETGAEYLPFPYWLKDNDGVMISLNSAYEKAFLHPLGFKKADYIGKKDSAIWNEQTAEAFKQNDDKAKKAKDKIWIGQEKTAKVLEGWEFMKFSRFFEGQLVGVGGLAIRKDFLT